MEALEIEEEDIRNTPSSLSLHTVKTQDSDVPAKEIPDEEEGVVTPVEKKTWKFFGKKKKTVSNASLKRQPRKLVKLRRREKQRSQSENVLFNKNTRTLNSTLGRSKVVSEKTREPSFLFDDRSVVSNHTTPRVRSTSSYGVRRRRKKNNKQKLEEARHKKHIEVSIRTLIENLCSSLADKNKKLFISLFSDEDSQICHPVGILKERDIPGYFERFVLIYASIWPDLDEGSIVIDLSHTGAHCEVIVTTQYTDTKEAAKYKEPQHWHFDFEVRACSLPTYESLKHPSKNKRESLEAPAYEVFIRKWHVYCSLAKNKKINDRTTADVWRSLVTWTKLGRKYGASYLNSHLNDAFSIEKEPLEIVSLLEALNAYSPEKLKTCLSNRMRMLVVEGLFSYRYYGDQKATEDDSFIVARILLRNFQKWKVQKVRCESVFRCGKHISARITLNLNKVLIPAFILMKVSGQRDTGAKNKITELLICSPQ